MALSFASISWTSYPAWLSALQASLGQPILHGSQLCKHPCGSLSWIAVSLIKHSVTAYPAWLWAFQPSLGQPVLNGCELNQASLRHPILNIFQLSKHLILSWMALSFASISGASDPARMSGTAYPEWLWAFQASLGQPILHGCKLFKHLWGSLSWMAFSFSSIFGAAYPECL